MFPPRNQTVVQRRLTLPSLSHTTFMTRRSLQCHSSVRSFSYVHDVARSPHGNKMSQINVWRVLLRFSWQLGNDFVNICHVENHVLQREESASVSWMTRIVPDQTFMNDPVLRYITSDSFFSNPTFGPGTFRLLWPKISLLTLHLVLDPFLPEGGALI